MNTLEMPVVYVSLSFCGNDFNHSFVTKQLSITPTTARGPEDWQASTMQYASMPGWPAPRCEWSYDIKRTHCTDVNISLHTLIDTFHDKVPMIAELKRQMDYATKILIVIHAEQINMPSIGLDRRAVRFLNSIDAEIEFDIYTN